jgi:hypothetical protein
VPIFADTGCRVVSVTDPYRRILGFLDRSHYFFFQVAPRLYSRGWVDPVSEPPLLRKSGSAGNRTGTSDLQPGTLNTRPQRRSRTEIWNWKLSFGFDTSSISCTEDGNKHVEIMEYVYNIVDNSAAERIIGQLGWSVRFVCLWHGAVVILLTLTAIRTQLTPKRSYQAVQPWSVMNRPDLRTLAFDSSIWVGTQKDIREGLDKMQQDCC